MTGMNITWEPYFPTHYDWLIWVVLGPGHQWSLYTMCSLRPGPDHWTVRYTLTNSDQNWPMVNWSDQSYSHTIGQLGAGRSVSQSEPDIRMVSGQSANDRPPHTYSHYINNWAEDWHRIIYWQPTFTFCNNKTCFTVFDQYGICTEIENVHHCSTPVHSYSNCRRYDAYLCMMQGTAALHSNYTNINNIRVSGSHHSHSFDTMSTECYYNYLCISSSPSC